MTRRLQGFSHRIVATPGYLEQRGTPKRPSELVSHACLHYRYPSSGKLEAWPLSEHGKPVHLDLPQSAVANAIDPLLAMAEAGQGIACLPDFILVDALAQGRLVSLLEAYVSDRRNFTILWPSSRQPLPKIKAFVDFMVNRLPADRG